MHFVGHTAQFASNFVVNRAWPMCDLTKTNIDGRQCLSRLFTHGRCFRTSFFWGPLHEIDGFTLVARIRASGRSRVNASEDF